MSINRLILKEGKPLEEDLVINNSFTGEHARAFITTGYQRNGSNMMGPIKHLEANESSRVQPYNR